MTGGPGSLRFFFLFFLFFSFLFFFSPPQKATQRSLWSIWLLSCPDQSQSGFSTPPVGRGHSTTSLQCSPLIHTLPIEGKSLPIGLVVSPFSWVFMVSAMGSKPSMSVNPASPLGWMPFRGSKPPELNALLL